jgi:hypothetical protein
MQYERSMNAPRRDCSDCPCFIYQIVKILTSKNTLMTCSTAWGSLRVILSNALVWLNMGPIVNCKRKESILKKMEKWLSSYLNFRGISSAVGSVGFIHWHDKARPFRETAYEQHIKLTPLVSRALGRVGLPRSAARGDAFATLVLEDKTSVWDCMCTDLYDSKIIS